ncbi:MAG TPA: DMT family transporter [Acidimicrobiia bacterium]|nr:DMT family transporter [Acidimicrobiia bacterium]
MLTLNRHRTAPVLIGAAASWGIATVITKHALGEIPPITLLPIQLAASVLLVTPFLLLRQREPPRTERLGKLTALGVLNPGISYALGLLGLVFITASESVLLWATEPIMIMALAAVMLREQITRAQVIAAGVASAGVALIVITPDRSNRPIGIALTLAAVAACAIYTVLSRRWMIDESSLRVVIYQQTAALAFALILLSAVVLAGGIPRLSGISAGSWVSAIVSGWLYYGIAFWLYLTGLQRTPASVAGQYINLIPVFGIAASSLFLDEQLSARQWVGAVIIVGAVTVAGKSLALAGEVRS